MLGVHRPFELPLLCLDTKVNENEPVVCDAQMANVVEFELFLFRHQSSRYEGMFVRSFLFVPWPGNANRISSVTINL